MQVFWSHGYNGTSLPDLIEGTGLSRGSLYKAFGDKKGLFLAGLDLYIARACERVSSNLQTPGPVKAAIHEALLRYAQLASGPTGRRGCPLVAAATEMVPHDAEISERIGNMFAWLQNAFAAAIERGQAQGEIAADQDSQTLARLLLCLTQGMRAVGKTGVAKKDMIAVIDTAMRILD
ncbi:TetR/AcrR family transcriptional regulator [Paraburkholderia sp. DHOC27]|nr:TetR/AcrR family transcriptional regulator [Paraburkholderia sp. DHOC27]